MRAEAEFDIDGITVVSVLPPKQDEASPFERLEILGPQREFTPVTSTLATREERRDRGDRGERRERRPRPDRPDRDRAPRRDRPPRPEGERGGDHDRPSRPRRDRPAPPPPLPERPKPKKLRPGRAHRDEFLASLTPDRRLIAEQLLKGGVAAVRSALDEQNAKARAEGAPEVPTANILQVAEDLLPASRIAEWLDKADAALADVEEISLNDLRAVVTSAGDVAREERSKPMAATLREALDRRSAVELEQWVSDIKLGIQHGRVVRALRLASRPPEQTQTLPAEVHADLAAAAGAAMTAEIAPDRFGTLLDAVAYSPVRRDVTPAGVPAEPGDELLALVRKHAGRTPAIATLFGVEPPPPKDKPGRKPRPPRAKASPEDKPKPAGPPIDVGGRKIPPPPRPSKSAMAPPPPGAPSAPASLPDAETPAASAELSAAPEAEVPAASTEPLEPAPEPAAAPTPIGEATADDAAADETASSDAPGEG